MSDYCEREKFWCMMKGIEIGTRVMITDKAESKENGWGDKWISDMTELIGRQGVVTLISSDSVSECSRETGGIRVKIDGNCRHYFYPYWVVSPVK